DSRLTLCPVQDGAGQISEVLVVFQDPQAVHTTQPEGPIDSHRLAHHRLRALTRVSASLTFDQPMEATLDALAAGVVEVTQAVACSVVLIDEEQELYRIVGTSGLPPDYASAAEESYRAGANLSSIESYRTLQPVRRTASRYIAYDPLQTRLSGIIQGAGWDTLVSLPLVYRNRALGAVTICFPIGVEPDEQELAFLLVVADQAAVAVQTARLFAEQQGKAALEERQRLARELHDSVSQALFGIGLGARTARTLLDRDPLKAIEPLDFVITLAEAGLTEMRALIFELRPDALLTEGLVRLLEQQAAALRTRHNLEVETDFGPEPMLPLVIKEMLFRIAQEAIHNITKHARASHVSLSLHSNSQGTVLIVSDDGIGFDPLQPYPGHLGLHSMRERAETHGASTTLTSAFGAGTRLHVQVPPR
ncbi:MAG TPA: GAF domain-containing sensor histidine kinase, partial [Thermomicrobiales bacterium]|nr:GAF domain-containing sensor histidine kinase [Thermomicrobiales bacterium]